MKCEQCGNEHNGEYGSGRFCSNICKQRYNFTNSGKKFKCIFCGREFCSPVSLGGHIVSCKSNPKCGIAKRHAVETAKKNYNEKNPIEHHVLVCTKCGKEYELDIRRKDFENGKYRHCCSVKCAHSRVITEEHKRKARETIKKTIENKLLQPNVEICQECGEEFISYARREKNKWNSKRFCSNECINKHRNRILSEKAKDRCERGEFGGKNNDTYKKHKHGWYNGIYCGSSWELAFVIWAIENGKNIKRCDIELKYEYNGKTFNYYPDFEIDGILYEIKGFENYKAIAKHEQYPDIVYINKNKIRPYLKYVIEKYGKNYTEMLCKHE